MKEKKVSKLPTVLKGSKGPLIVGTVIGALGTVAAILTGNEKEAIGCCVVSAVCGVALVEAGDIANSIEISELQDRVKDLENK